MPMRVRGQKQKYTFTEYMCFAFLFFCFMPFLFPNPIVTTDIQPYAVVVGAVILVLNLLQLDRTPKGRIFFLIALLTFVVALGVMLLNDISLGTFRAVYNYAAVLIIPAAVCVSLTILGAYPERFVKGMILIWFVVSVVQLLFSRSFLSGIISGGRWTSNSRGVLGLASEPSFFGIACFYFLHLVRYFKTQQALFTGIVLLMGIFCAQSAMGIVFIAGYFLVYLFDIINNRKGFIVWVVAILGVVVFVYVLNNYLADTRLHQLYQRFVEDGLAGLVEDKSTGTRVNSITNALSITVANYLMPVGFTTRIGSGFGGFLVELGIFAVPILICISLGMAYTFRKIRSRIFYFVVITILLLNNTQLGNPLLMMVIGTNLWMISHYEQGDRREKNVSALEKI